MVAVDGQVRVMDFGLARGLDSDRDASAPVPAHVDDDAPAITLQSELTAAGAIVGTPAYMAPEQFARLPLDARTDQFSFCVALHEALYGERPFAGETLAELARRVCDGELREPPRGARVPAKLRRALLRGLAPDPAARYPTMEALLADLSLGTNRRWLWLAVTALSLVAGLLVSRALDERATLCSGGPAQWADVWSDARREVVRAGMLASGQTHAGPAFARAAAVFDAYTAAWLLGYREACEATHLRGEQSDELLDLRIACLGRRREAVRAAVDLLAAADTAVVDRAVDLAHALPPVADCADTESLTSRTRLPDNPAIRAAIDAAQSRLSAAEASAEAGKFVGGLELARAALAEARALDRPPLVAEALLIEGRLQAHVGDLQAAEDDLLGAVDAAAGARDDVVELAAWTELVRVVGGLAARHAEGLMLAKAAAASLKRAGATPAREAELAYALARLHEGRGKLPEARAELERALALHTSHLGRAHPKIGRLYVALGDVAREQGDLPAARAAYGEAREILVTALGDDHPDVAAVHNSTGNVNFRAGDFAAARGDYQAALAIREAVLGRDHPDVAATLNNMGAVHEKLGEHARALELHHRALAIRRAVYGPAHPKVAMSLANIGNVHTLTRSFDAAIRHHREALAIREVALGLEHPSTGESLGSLASAMVQEARDLPGALDHARRSLVVFEKALGPSHPNVAAAHFNIASVLGLLGRHREALESWDRALAAIDAHGQPSPLRWPIRARRALSRFAAGERDAAVAALNAELTACEAAPERDECRATLQFALAKITWARGDRRRAIEIAEAALPALDGSGRDDLKQWLASLPSP